MGPVVRYLGPEVPSEVLIWQDPLPAVDHELVDARRHRRAQGADPRLRPDGLAAGLDRVGVGLDVPRQRQARRRQRRPDPPRAAERLGGQQPGRARGGAAHPRGHPGSRSTRAGGKKVSLADLIVLAGDAGVEKAAADAGFDVEVPFTPGRADASAEQTDVESFAYLEPKADGFRNYLGKGNAAAGRVPADRQGEPADADRAGADRAASAACACSARTTTGPSSACSPTTPGTLTNDFFVNLLDYDTTWTPVSEDATTFEGRTRRAAPSSGPAPGSTWSSARTPSCARSPRSTRATTRRRSSSQDFVAAWAKVMDADRFDVA